MPSRLRARQVLQWSALASAIVAVLALVPYLHHRVPPDSIARVERAHLSPARDSAEVKPVALPHDWLASGLQARDGWYRMTVELDAVPERQWAVYLPTAATAAAVWVNGYLVGDGGVSERPLPRGANRPLLFTVDRDRLVEGANTIEVHLGADPVGSGFLSVLYIGPATVLAPIYELRMLMKVGVVWAITLGLSLLGLFIGALWLGRRRESLYGWFALVTLMWAIHNLNILVLRMPVTGWLWDWITRFGSLQWFAILGVIFVNRHMARPQPRVERALCLAGAAVMAVFALLPLDSFYTIAPWLWSPSMLLIGIYAVYRIGLACRLRPTREALVLLASGLVVIAFGCRDIFVVNAIWDRQQGLYLHYAAPLVLVAFAWILLERFVSALNASESLNAELEHRVAVARRELEQNYERLRAFERERVLVQERERIMRDMHDGMGGHLVSTLALIERGRADLREVSQCLRAALTDLRLMIDSLDVSAGDVTSLLGMIRERLHGRLTASGITLEWRVEPLPGAPALGPQHALQMMRIVQEAITNVLKHAEARTLTVRAAEEADAGGSRVVIEIADDGRGFDVSGDSAGRGLANMRYRAASLGADLSIRSERRGTRIAISLPLVAGGQRGLSEHRRQAA